MEKESEKFILPSVYGLVYRDSVINVYAQSDYTGEGGGDVEEPMSMSYQSEDIETNSFRE